MPVDGIFGASINLLGKSLDLRAKRQVHIAGNLANVETPGYIPTTLSFEKELQDAARTGKQGGHPAVTHPRHIPVKNSGSDLAAVQGHVLETPARSVGNDGNGVELENEMSRMAENQIMFNASVQLLGKNFETLKTAIKGSL